MNILGVDIGGTNLKFRSQRQEDVIKVPSGPRMTPEFMMKAIHQHTVGWKYDHVSVGFPGPVIHDRPLLEPHNLGRGWVRFDFKKAFGGKPLQFRRHRCRQEHKRLHDRGAADEPAFDCCQRGVEAGPVAQKHARVQQVAP